MSSCQLVDGAQLRIASFQLEVSQIAVIRLNSWLANVLIVDAAWLIDEAEGLLCIGKFGDDVRQG